MSRDATEDKVKTLIDSIEPGINQVLRSTEDYAKHLKFVAALPHYSLNNCILIEAQMMAREMEPDAVMSFTGWKSVGRHVNSGESGLMILCPCPKNIRVSEPLLDDSGQPKLDAEGNTLTHDVNKTIMRYKVGYTFAESQTSGEPIPSTVSLLTGDVNQYEFIMEAIKKIAPGEVRIEPISSGANGYYSPSTKVIAIKDTLDQKHQVHTGFHELGHAIADELGLDVGCSRAEKECEAESISFVLMNHVLGDQATPEELGRTYTFGYIDSWSPDTDLTNFKSMLSNIQKGSCELIDRFDTALEEVVLEHTSVIAYKSNDALLYVECIDAENFEYSLYDSHYHLLDGGTYESSERIDIVSEHIREMHDIPVHDFHRISVEDLQTQLDNAYDSRKELAADIASVINKERAERSLEPIPEQLIFAELENGSAEKGIKELMRIAKLQNEDAMALVGRLEMDGINMTDNLTVATTVSRKV
ncbi:MAG: hypothetical protein IKU29_10040 [Parabacteroides sp.]|nr:hypothetical protein [Parabacteroides sp.]